MTKKIKIVLFLAVVLIVAILLSLTAKLQEKKEVIEEKRMGAVGKEQMELLVFFQEEALAFLPEKTQEELKERFSDHVRKEGEAGTTCAVVLTNITALSTDTYLVFLQTNEAQNNLYQVIVNAAAGFFDLERSQKEIVGIESYGGAGYGDSIERIYLQAGDPGCVQTPERTTLEEETEAKWQEYVNGTGQTEGENAYE